MPHLTVEYSLNLATQLDPPKLLEKLHASLKSATGLDMNRVKSRLLPVDQVLSGEAGSEMQMIHITLAILSGRDAESRKLYGEILFSELSAFVPPARLPYTSLTVEIREMDKAAYFRN